MKETLERIAERLDNLIKNNATQHSEIIEKIKELSEYANHQITTCIERIDKLEDTQLVALAKYKGRMELFKWISLALGALLSVMGILAALHVI